MFVSVFCILYLKMRVNDEGGGVGVGVRGCVARITRLFTNVVTVKGCCPKAMNVHSLLVGFKEHRKWFRANRFIKPVL